MSPESIFGIHLVLGYVACGLWFGAYILPRLRAMSRFEAQRVIATLHSFRFFGLAFLLPGVVGPHLPAGFAAPTAYGDFVTGALALLALFSMRVRPLFWFFVVAFNLIGTADLILAYANAMRVGLPAMAEQLGALYVIPVVYVPMLMITHGLALSWLVRGERVEAREA